jgi:hypothetical protein
MPVTWQALGSFALPFREWLRLPPTPYSELFRFQFNTPDWEAWNRYHSGAVLVRPVYVNSDEGEEIGQDTRLWVDDTRSPRVIEIPYPNGYLTSGISVRSLELYRYPKRRYAQQLTLSVIVDRA